MLVSKTEQVKIIDFNVAHKESSSEFKIMSKVGQNEWIAPEVFKGGFYNEKIDLWGVGCILYFIITG
jgi:calcium-dependent protein kinase